MAKKKKNKSKNPAAKAKKKQAKGSKSKSSKPKMALTADYLDLYQRAVQAPEADVEFFTDRFKELRGRKPLSLREDFCGTALACATWVASSKKRTAVGIDLDAPTLAWGQKHNIDPIGDAGSRVTLLEANVLDGTGPKADIVCAMNFSYSVFQTRETLRRYFEVVLDRLEPDGVFFTELFGGLEAVVEIEEKRECDGFTYVWEQESFNPIDHHMVCHIGFEFPDGSKLRRCLSYDWRLWTMPEIRELLIEAGFSEVHVYWESVDEDGDGTGEFHRTVEEENQESWLAYIIAVK